MACIDFIHGQPILGVQYSISSLCGVITLRNGLKEYLSGMKNAVRDEFIISRERSKKTDSELVFIQHPEMREPLYTFWHTRRSGKKPKHTGGKKPYVMLMVEGLIELMEKGMPAEYAGYLLYLVPYIEWGTGRLLYGRTKRSMKFRDIQKIFDRSYVTTLKIISRLKQYNLLTHTKEGYFISRDIVKRGGKNADKV